MRRIGFFLIVLPLAVLLILFMVANRAPVVVSFDPFAAANPAIAFEIPLFILIFLTLMVGVLVGGVADWLRQGHWRREARARRDEVRRLEAEKARSAAASSNLPAIRS